MSATTGKKTIFVADPQPGTSNQPFPVGNLPPFVPVEITSVDEHPLAIYGQTNTMLARNEIIMMGMIQLTNAMNSIADRIQGELKMTTEINIALSGLATSLGMIQTSMAAKSSSNIKTNDVYNGKFNDTLPYKEEISKINSQLPPIEQQIAESIADGQIISEIAVKQVTVTQFIQGAVDGLTNWFKDTTVYTSAKKFVSDIFESIISIIPDSWRGVSNNSKAISGDSTIGR